MQAGILLLFALIVLAISVTLSPRHDRFLPAEARECKDEGLPTDIMYSCLVHEAPDVFLDTLNNLFFYHANFHINVIVHCNHIVFQPLHELIRRDTRFRGQVFLYPQPWDKKIATFDLLEAHLENFRWCTTNNRIATYFIPLASNCYFWKQLESSDLIYDKASYSFGNIDISTFESDHWHWQTFRKNHELIDELKKAGVEQFLGRQHEGLIVPWSVMRQVSDFEKAHNLRRFAHQNVTYEEILWTTLINMFLGHEVENMCEVFWDLPNYTPSIENIQQSTKPCVKRVSRTMDDPVRVWQREVTADYMSEHAKIK